MFRLRRYRIVLAVTVFTLAGLYYLANLNSWTPPSFSTPLPFTSTSSSSESISFNKFKVDNGFQDSVPTKEEDVLEQLNQDSLDARPEDFPHLNLPGSLGGESKLAQDTDNIPKLKSASNPKPVQPEPYVHPAAPLTPAVLVATSTSTKEVIHWTPMPEKYPVSSTIALPTGKATSIPQIQASFGEEDPAHAKTRKARLGAIKAAMTRHWAGYKKFAWGHDELRPISGGFKDPFAGWGATLVDSLDTLWIMGMQDEFDEAVQAVGKIDFTTTDLKHELPLFEVTIRYLGGLLSGYDVSGQRHQILLDKAVELANVLFGAFDTENRMPITYYRWQPENVPLYHRAGSSVVLAELGTLSMEFTRLSQLTGEPKYYDAVARITNEFHHFQNRTKLPGMWPLFVDATGCQQTSTATPSSTPSSSSAPAMPLIDVELDLTSTSTSSLADGIADDPRKLKDVSSYGEKDTTPVETVPQVPKVLENLAAKDRSSFEKRQAPADSSKKAADSSTKAADTSKKAADTSKKAADTSKKVQCDAVVLQSATYSQDAFTLGGMADSVYEYLPKEYLLLGGLNKQYQTMHESAMATIKEYVLYRPMLKDEKRDVRFTGTFRSKGTELANGRIEGTLDEGTGHLTCFIGAVVGLGAKIFNRPDELSLAEKLTDGCVWAYESTATGIMPEDIHPVVCDDMKRCPWNETVWWEKIDGGARHRVEMEMQQWEKNRQAEADEALEAQALLAGESELGRPAAAAPGMVPRAPPAVAKVEIPVYDESNRPKTYEAYMRERVEKSSLAPGISRYGGTQYLLRPEAIESVWYMYRITGDSKWQDKGWSMWQAIDKYTKTEYGNSAIKGVIMETPTKDDAAESFWSGETLKYFYLLFSEPSVISLDDYVLNTEAHPFIRPDGALAASSSTPGSATRSAEGSTKDSTQRKSKGSGKTGSSSSKEKAGEQAKEALLP